MSTDESSVATRAFGDSDRRMASEIVERIVEQNLGVYKASPSRLQEDVSQEAQVASDYRGRLVYELLQNADDAMESSKSGTDRVVFVITDDDFWMANSGRPLTNADVEGLCGLGASSKVDTAGTKRASIGHKGLGFKSVLEITECPSVYSRTLSFRLGAGEARSHVEQLWDKHGRSRPAAVPAMRFPSLIEDAEDSNRWSRLQDSGLNTAFQFPFRKKLTSEQRQSLTDLLLKLPLTTVLFLKHLESVEVQVDQTGHSKFMEWTVSREMRRNGQWHSVPGLGDSGLYKVTVSSSTQESAAFYVAHDARVAIGPNREGLSGPAWEGVDLTEVSVAALANEPESGMPEEWRRFHVFLPTEERCPYPMLVSGAFATDLSRQQIRVRTESGDYNSHLVRKAAQLFVEQMVPELQSEGVERVLSVLDRGQTEIGGDVAEFFHECLVQVLANKPLIPTESGQILPIDACALPSPLLDKEGEEFRSVLVRDANWDGAEFPSAKFCRGRWACVAADHGARQLTPTECLAALGTLADPQRSSIREHKSGYYEVDPILDLSAFLWERADATERLQLKFDARRQKIFPIHRNDDRSVVRVTLAEDTAFYPPQSAKRDFPLRGLRLMCHSVCWGALNKNERNDRLGDKMRTWSILFDIKEYSFQEVMQAAVLPALTLNPTPAPEEIKWKEDLLSRKSLAAICQLAGTFSKPDRPLRYQRLQNERALFNLSRLPVPCIDDGAGEKWVPAYRVYFGRAWLGDGSFEHVIDALPDDSEVNAHLLAPPDQFLGLLDSDGEAPVIAAGNDDDEVDLNEDIDRSLETNEFDRWLNFFSWIGVNRSLRLVHFHDVEDRDSGWLTTKDLKQPKGWAFRNLDMTWSDYRAELKAKLDGIAGLTDKIPYLYDVHDLDHALPLIEAAEQDASAQVASRLFEHLIKHWGTYAPLTDSQLALVDKGKWPSGRSKPPRAIPEEVTPVGDNLWLYRLRTSGICPTSMGPRRPEVTWRRTQELERRFSSSQGNLDAGKLVPVLKQTPQLPGNSVRTFCEYLGVRAEVSPSAFTVEDADLLCQQLKRLYGNGAVDKDTLRQVIKPTYRSMFELLSGHSASTDRPLLGSTPLLVEQAEGYQFLPATEVLFASTPGIKERTGLSGQVPVFVLEAESAVAAPVTSIFGSRILERVLEWHPNPGECPLTDLDLAEMRQGLRQLVAPLLARIRAIRTNPQDRSNLIEFTERIEPVDELDLTCTLDGVKLERQQGRDYFVRTKSASETFRGFIKWVGPSWPPAPETAQRLAMALADTLGVNLVETFLAFITSDDQQRQQLLNIAGAFGLYQDALDELSEDSSVQEEVEPPVVVPTAAPESERFREERRPSGPDVPQPASPIVPLYSFDALLLSGKPLIVTGERNNVNSRQKRSDRSDSSSATVTANRTPPGTDLSALDALGMQISIAYEARRLKRAYGSVKIISDGVLQQADGLRAYDTLVVDVHTPAAIASALELSDVVKRVMEILRASGVSPSYPGFDLLSIRGGEVDRLIELKSSGVDARVQEMSWNEWKSASHSDLRSNFWLYLVGNLRADLENAPPFVRAIKDPFGSLVSNKVEDQQLRRAVQLRVREFETAEHLNLTVTNVEETENREKANQSRD